MQNREFGRRSLPSVHRRRKIFNHRKNSGSRPALVVGTLVVGLALVFTIGFKFGRTYQTESVAAVDHSVGVLPETVAHNGSLARE